MSDQPKMTDVEAERVLERVPDSYTPGPWASEPADDPTDGYSIMGPLGSLREGETPCLGDLYRQDDSDLAALAPDLAAALRWALGRVGEEEQRNSIAMSAMINGERVAVTRADTAERALAEAQTNVAGLRAANQGLRTDLIAARQEAAEQQVEVERLAVAIGILEAERDGWVDGTELEAALDGEGGQDG